MRRQLLLSFLLFFIMLLIMRWQGATLITEETPYGIIDLEFAKTSIRLLQIQDVWNESDFKTNTLFDFLFIITYTWFFYIACQFIRYKTSWKRFVRPFVIFTLVACVLDICENLFMLIGWYNTDSSFFLEAAYFCALLKFAFIAFVLLFIIAGFSLGYLQKRLSRRRSQL